MPAALKYTEIPGFIGAAGKHPLFLRWREMKKRCSNPRHAAYQNYGGRGIKVCERWHDFGLFVADMGMPPTAEHSIDRMEGSGDYEPGNCRWATKAEQANNRNCNVFVEALGIRLTVGEWEHRNKVKKKTYWSRIFRLGWDPVDAVTIPVQRGLKYTSRLTETQTA